VCNKIWQIRRRHLEVLGKVCDARSINQFVNLIAFSKYTFVIDKQRAHHFAIAQMLNLQLTPAKKKKKKFFFRSAQNDDVASSG
jgi:hypothetical protein